VLFQNSPKRTLTPYLHHLTTSHWPSLNRKIDLFILLPIVLSKAGIGYPSLATHGPRCTSRRTNPISLCLPIPLIPMTPLCRASTLSSAASFLLLLPFYGALLGVCHLLSLFHLLWGATYLGEESMVHITFPRVFPTSDIFYTTLAYRVPYSHLLFISFHLLNISSIVYLSGVINPIFSPVYLFRRSLGLSCLLSLFIYLFIYLSLPLNRSTASSYND
jgi:hypothetical protein